MKKVALFLIVILSLCPCAQALTISSQVTVSHGVQMATYWIDDYVIYVYGDNYYTYDSSEGRYTFYSNGFYTPGDRDVINYYKPMEVVWYEGDYMLSGFIDQMGAISSTIFDQPMPRRVSTDKLCFTDDSISGFLGFIANAENVPLLASPNGKKLFDARIGHFVYIYNEDIDTSDYWHVNYEKYDGYIHKDYLSGAGDISNRKTIITTCSTLAFSTPDASGIVMGDVDEGTEILSTYENDLWYECMPFGGLRRYYIPKSSAKVK